MRMDLHKAISAMEAAEKLADQLEDLIAIREKLKEAEASVSAARRRPGSNLKRGH